MNALIVYVHLEPPFDAAMSMCSAKALRLQTRVCAWDRTTSRCLMRHLAYRTPQ